MLDIAREFFEVLMAKPVASRGSDQFMVRMPEGMRERINALAEQSGRSMNSEIVARLEESFNYPSFIQKLDETEVKLAAAEMKAMQLLNILKQQEKVYQLQKRVADDLDGANGFIKKTLASVEYVANMYRNAVDRAARGDAKNLDALLRMHKERPLETYDETVPDWILKERDD